MKYITKQSPPQQFIGWKHTKRVDFDGQPMLQSYEDIPADIREKIKESLLQEQGGICCYTGRKVTLNTSHIEHLKPQALCINHEDTDYSNMLAAYPSDKSPQQCHYGAHPKKNWYDESLFIHPLRRDCETRLRYNLNGNITPTNKTDQGALETIRRLCLNHRELKELRENAIHGALFEKQLTKAQVQRLLAAMDIRDSNENFRPFCFVIKQACEKYLKRFD